MSGEAVALRRFGPGGYSGKAGTCERQGRPRVLVAARSAHARLTSKAWPDLRLYSATEPSIRVVSTACWQKWDSPVLSCLESLEALV